MSSCAKSRVIETKLNNTIAAECSQKARQQQANKVLKTGLYAKDARHMVEDRLELEEKKEKEREEAWKKRYIFSATKIQKNKE